MALAILELVAFENENVRFRIDTGTNRYYRLKIGTRVRRANTIDWVDEVVFATPVATNEVGGELLNSSKEIALPVGRLADGHGYVQLFSFKTPDGRSPAFSRVLEVPADGGLHTLDEANIPALSLSAAMNMTNAFNEPRAIPCRTGADVYARTASWGELLGQVVKVAAPAVLKLLAGGQKTPSNGTPAPAGAAAALQDDLVALLLKMVTGGLQAVTSQTASIALPPADPLTNRFADVRRGGWSRPFVFGVDDALIAAAIGPLVQILPDLMNSANQKRVQLKQANNKLITDLMSDLNRRLLLERLADAQRQAPAGQSGSAPDLTQLIQLLQQAGPAQHTESPAPAAAPQSLAVASSAYAPSSRAVLSFATADPVRWNGRPTLLFSRNQPLRLRVRFTVGDPAPRRPLPKAALTVVFKDDSDQTVWFRKTLRPTNVAANAVIDLALAQDEIARLPVNRRIAVVAELRWSTAQGRRYTALGSTEIVLVNRYFLVDQGEGTGERELTDMTRFKPFWNKVWEAPTLGAGAAREGKRYLWELNVDARYTVLLSPDHDANGLMQTRVARGKPDPDSLTETIEGRMKAGIELSMSELNKLLPLWDAQPLEADRLDALATPQFATSNAGEFVYNVKLRGRAGERGMVWVIPVFKLFDVTLSAVQRVDDTGQVLAIADENVRFPLPVAARVIGLKSERS
ncbi:MAG: hypothetical protein HYU37_16355 [Acidobacteria bacterium]|nr:hypothetical protein [Acidobacteriota bacterium]